MPWGFDVLWTCGTWRDGQGFVVLRRDHNLADICEPVDGEWVAVAETFACNWQVEKVRG
jgi:hypothetical protein